MRYSPSVCIYNIMFISLFTPGNIFRSIKEEYKIESHFGDAKKKERWNGLLLFSFGEWLHILDKTIKDDKFSFYNRNKLQLCFYV